MAPDKRTRGLSLVELMVGLAVLAIFATIAAPAMNDFISKTRIRGAAEALVEDLVYARSEAVLRNRTVTVSITTGSAWCYGLDDAGTCNCGTAGDCNVKTVPAARYPGTSLSSDFSSLAFDPVQGTISGVGGTIGTGTILVGNALGQAGAKPSPVGIKLCAPSEYHGVMGYPSC